MKRWYAIYSKPRQDSRAALHLQNQGFSVFRPLARVRKRVATQLKYCVESLFPRYLFIHLDDTGQSWAPIRSTRGVAGLVQGERHRPATVPDALIEDLRQRSNEDGWIDLESETALHPGDRVVVAEGAFQGYEAIYRTRAAADRVVVLLSLLGSERTVELPEAVLVKALN